jgi:hypothetical protein
MGNGDSAPPKRTVLITKPVCVINFQVYLLSEVKLLGHFKGINLQQLYNDNMTQFAFVPQEISHFRRDYYITRNKDSIMCYFVRPEHKSKIRVYDDGRMRLGRLDMPCRNMGFANDLVKCSVETLNKIGVDVDHVDIYEEKAYICDGSELPLQYVPERLEERKG